MRIPSASTDRKIFFVAVDATDLKTRETGLTTFTVVGSLDGAADVTFTTPTVAEIDNTTMPGVYTLVLDELTTLASGHDTEELCLHITQASMAPVTRVVEIYRPKFTEGQAATMANNRVDAEVEAIAANAITATAINNDAFTAAKFASDVTTEFQNGLATAAELAKVPKSDSNVTWNATAAAQLQSEANDALVAYDPPTRAEATADKDEILTIANTIESQTDDIGVAGAGLTAITTKTDNLPSDPADQSAVEAKIDSSNAAQTAILRPRKV